MRRRTNRRLLSSLGVSLAVASLSVGAMALAGPASADTTGADATAAMATFAAINADRATAGLPPLTWSASLAQIALSHSAAMAQAGQLFHNPSLSTLLAGAALVGENVGVGPTVSILNTDFMNSPEHRANLLSTQFTQVGAGVVDANGIVWVTEDFVEAPPAPLSASVATAAIPAAAPTAPTPAAPAPAAPVPAAQTRPAPPSPPEPGRPATTAPVAGSSAPAPVAGPAVSTPAPVPPVATATPAPAAASSVPPATTSPAAAPTRPAVHRLAAVPTRAARPVAALGALVLLVLVGAALAYLSLPVLLAGLRRRPGAVKPALTTVNARSVAVRVRPTAVGVHARPRLSAVPAVQSL